ncbi:MAG TPA: hypothetical protein VGE08_06675 [Steroidobacter sp.]|uniref:hypothetical protein n=1 Tax=Steroidobacter sp. TaxID=1978227 RepID=UPI002EDAD403
MKHSVPLILLMLAGCVAQPPVKSWLDPVSVATLTSQSTPLVLARASSSSMIQRTFAQLTAVEVNRMGTRRLYLVLVPRITNEVTPTQLATFQRSFDQIELRADERAIALARYTGDLAELGIGEPELLPIFTTRFGLYPVERADLRALVDSKQVTLVAMGLQTPRTYEEWNDSRHSLRDFLAQLPGEATAAQQRAP